MQRRLIRSSTYVNTAKRKKKRYPPKTTLQQWQSVNRRLDDTSTISDEDVCRNEFTNIYIYNIIDWQSDE